MRLIDQLIDGPRNEANTKMLHYTRAKLSCLYNSKEIYWARRLRIRWLKERDKNTRFFHVRASHCHIKNWIEGLQNEAGMWISNERGLCDVTRNYFETLFMSECNGNFEEVLNKIPRCVSTEMNSILDSPIVDREIMDAFGRWTQGRLPVLTNCLTSFIKKTGRSLVKVWFNFVVRCLMGIGRWTQLLKQL